ncbi:MAG: hypothetical protein RL722_1981 [Pseudomonadota bacterium]
MADATSLPSGPKAAALRCLHAGAGAALSGPHAAVIDEAARALTAGQLVAFPTETVYGLGARADDEVAVARIFAAKGRPADHPLIVHLPADGDLNAAALAWASELDPLAQRLMQACWPGPLTLIVPRRPEMGRAAAGGQDSIGLRCPDHPVAQALLSRAAELGVSGVAAPSANRFGRISPTRAEHVLDEFRPVTGSAVLPDGLLVLDGGASRVGIESAIIDCTRGHPVLLRPGLWSVEELSEFAGQALRGPDGAAPRASGTLAAHYAPEAPLRLLPADRLQAELLAYPEADRAGLAVYCRAAPAVDGVLWRRMPASPGLLAHELFAVLRELDAAPVSAIWVEQPPGLPGWDGVHDRLRRAAAASAG